jgi:hypothetical protein
VKEFIGLITLLAGVISPMLIPFLSLNILVIVAVLEFAAEFMPFIPFIAINVSLLSNTLPVNIVFALYALGT